MFYHCHVNGTSLKYFHAVYQLVTFLIFLHCEDLKKTVFEMWGSKKTAFENARIKKKQYLNYDDLKKTAFEMQEFKKKTVFEMQGSKKQYLKCEDLKKQYLNCKDLKKTIFERLGSKKNSCANHLIIWFKADFTLFRSSPLPLSCIYIWTNLIIRY